MRVPSTLIWTALATAACDHPHATVTVEMLADKTIVLHTVDPRFPNFPVETLRPGSSNYSAIMQMVGGVAPGEAKVMPQFVGRVDMAEDRTVTHSFWGRADNGAQLSGRETARPGDRDYKRILGLVQHLEPGHWAIVEGPSCDAEK